MTTSDIASKLVAYCRKGEFEAAQKELYSPDSVSIEPASSPAFAKETKGLQAIITKGHTFNATIEEYHSIDVSDSIVAGQTFACVINLDVTMKGPGRTKMTEVAVYTVKDEKIIAEQFFY